MNLNVTVISGNLTRDPEMRSTSGGLSICKMRVAVNTRRKDGATGEWQDVPNFFNVTVFGKQADNCGQYLEKGRPIAVNGELRWHEWETPEGQKREAVEIVANNVQFLGGGDGAGRRTTESDIPVAAGDFAPSASAPGADDDIPF